jgi:hypothetical protein
MPSTISPIPHRPSWRSQIAEGRVFELRSKSKYYPAPCALVIDAQANGYNRRAVVAVDRLGVIGDGLYRRRHNPHIHVSGLRPEQFNSSHILRRRRDLERFDADDLALIRYGLALDFSGRIRGNYSDMNIPAVIPAQWTVFWMAAWGDGDYRWIDRAPELDRLLHGAWHFESSGGARRLGYKCGHLWATRHTGKRLVEIRRFLRSKWGSALIEQPVQVARWQVGDEIYTQEIRRECPALGSRMLSIQSPRGWRGIYA